MNKFTIAVQTAFLVCTLIIHDEEASETCSLTPMLMERPIQICEKVRFPNASFLMVPPKERPINNKQRREIRDVHSAQFRNIQFAQNYQVVIREAPPYVIKEFKDGIVHYSGYCVDILFEISKMFNFSYTMYESPDKKYGNFNATGSWNGVIGELLNKRADIGLTNLFFFAERMKVVDFSIPFCDPTGLRIMMKRNFLHANSMRKFVSVFEYNVWLGLIGAFLITSVVIWIFELYSPYSYFNALPRSNSELDKRRIFTLKESMWYCLISMTPQGGGQSPRQLSGRFLVATWWLFCFLIMAAHTANLTAFLTIRRLESNIKSFKDLAKQNQLEYGVIPQTRSWKFFERMVYIEKKFFTIWKNLSLGLVHTSPSYKDSIIWENPISDVYTKMWNEMQMVNLPKTVEEAKQRVEASKSGTDGFAFIGESATINSLVEHDCSLAAIGEEVNKKPYVIAFQKGSALKITINEGLLALMRDGRLETLKRKWSLKKKEKDCEEDEKRISIANIGGAFVVIFAGTLSSVIALTYEYYTSKGEEIKLGVQKLSQQQSL